LGGAFLLGDDHGRTLELGDADKPTRGVVVAIAHRIQLTKSAYIQPDIQFISRPGGTGSIDDAVVIDVRMDVSF
jgi:porin